MSRRDPDDDIDTLLTELESTLRDLRDELREGGDDRDREPGRDADRDRGHDDGRRRRPPRFPRAPRRGPRRPDEYGFPLPPRPPSPGDLLRFTSDYTIPTVIATLEATVEALELLRRFLQLAGGLDSDGRVSDRGRRGRSGSRLADGLAGGLSGAGTRATSDATDALSTLRHVLAEADLPEEGESRDLVDEVRELSAELDRRIAEATDSADRERDRERRTNRSRGRARDRDRRRDRGRGADEADGSDGADDGAVVIDVTDGDADETEGDDEADEPPEVDVDAELDSIKRELGRGEEDGTDGSETDAADDSDNSDDGDDSDGRDDRS